MENLERLATYVSWPQSCSRYSLTRLAAAGFRYCGVADEIRCDSCGVIIRDWSQQENLYPVREHARLSPRCQLLQPLSAATPSGEPFATGDSPSLRRRSPTTVTPHPSTWSTQLALAVPPGLSANTGMVSRDPERGSRSATDHRSGLLVSGTASVDGNATRTTFDQTPGACETRRGGCCAAEPGGYSADRNTGSNKPG